MDKRKSVPLLLHLEEFLESEEDDEDEHVAVAAAGILCAKVVRDAQNRIPLYAEETVGRFFDWEFRKHFRLTRERVREVSTRFGASPFMPEGKHGRPPIAAEKCVLIGLTYLGSQQSMYSIANIFDVTQSSVHMTMTRFLDFLCSISAEVIKLPTTDEKPRIAEGFSAELGLKGVVGAIDGSFIPIRTPAESPSSYYNRKKYHAIILQGICDDQKRFRDVFIGYPGRTHDAKVFKNSFVRKDIPGLCEGGYYLLGDGAYSLTPHLLTPYRDTGSLPEWQKNYNYQHSSQRVRIEHTFGLLKQRFRRLYFVDVGCIKRICKITMASCVLHNLCGSDDLPDDVDEGAVEDLHDPDEYLEDHGEEDPAACRAAKILRNQLAQSLPVVRRKRRRHRQLNCNLHGPD